MSKGKKIKKMSALLAGALLVVSATTFAGCTTAHPQVEMKISFNDSTYTLKYDLYRKVAPTTVDHFLDLVEKGYYDGLCIHNYTSGKWYTGGYTYSETTTSYGGLQEKNYFETVKDWALTQSVWLDADKKMPTNTLYGEFSSNGFSVTSGAKAQTFGSLTMYYTDKADVKSTVYVKRSDGDGEVNKDYKYNNATSLFYIYTSTSKSSASSTYCTFGTITDKTSSNLTSLQKAITDYITAQKEEDSDYSFTSTETGVPADSGDPFTGDTEQTYAVPKKPIIIQSIKIKKY